MNKRIPIFIGLVLICLACWVLITPNKYVRLFIDRLDNIGYDLQLRTHVLAKHAAITTPVAIIDIDDKSIKAIGRWPWSRDQLAILVDKLQQQGAAVIAFDIFFSEPENNTAELLLDKLKKINEKKLLSASVISALKKSAVFFNADNVFAKSISASSTVLALGFLPRKQTQNALPTPLLTLTAQQAEELRLITAAGYISNIPILQQAAVGSGFINIFSDSDGIIRRAPLLIRYGNAVYPALSLQAVLAFLSENIKLITPYYGKTQQMEGIQLGTTIIPTNAHGEVLIPFIGRSYTFPYYSALDVLHGTVPKGALLGKILFIGTSATGLGDLHATAIQNPFPGVEVQATLVNGLLLNHFSYKPAWTIGAILVLTILFGLITAFSFPYFGPRLLGSVILFFPPLVLFINDRIWERTGFILSLLLPVILVLVIAFLNIIYGYLFETRRREHLKEMFGQYVPEKHIDEMLKTQSDYGLHGEDRHMTVLFADIRNFTAISEKMSAAELVEMLNTFFTPMTEIIFKHRGTIDKYVGDLIMAFWGAPLKDKNHTRHAIESALEMQKKIKELNPIFAARNWPEIKIGIGINSGIMSVGDMGSQFRRNYTVLGDAVNLASRIESLTKFYGIDIIVTEHSYQQQPRFIFRQLDRVRVKGKQKHISIYEVICLQTDLTNELSKELAIYESGLLDYYAKRWSEAYLKMTELHTLNPEKKIYRIYLDRIQEYQQHPLPDDWDGVYVHVTK